MSCKNKAEMALHIACKETIKIDKLTMGKLSIRELHELIFLLQKRILSKEEEK